MKNKLRQQFRTIRDKLSLQRRNMASKQQLSRALSLAQDHPFVLSYSSFQSEFNTNELNHELAKNGKLVLPKVTGNTLKLFHVEHLFSQLIKSPWGIFEPNPALCQEIFPHQLTLVFVPAIAFDQNKQRIGYGKGFYDRLLSQLPSTTQTVGLGFQEQHYQKSFPTEKHDIALSELLLS